MKKYIIILLPILCFLIAATSVQIETEDKNKKFDEHRSLISAEVLRSHLDIIASDSLMGRGTGQLGIDMTADYLAGHLDELGFPKIGDDDSYFQTFNLKGSRVNGIHYSLFQNDEDGGKGEVAWVGSALRNKPTGFYNLYGGEQALTGDIVFAGFGLQDLESGLDNIKDIDVSNKWVMVFADIPEGIEELPENIEELIENRIMSLIFRRRALGVMVINHFDKDEYLHHATKLSQIIGNPKGIRLPDGGGRSMLAVSVKSVSPELATQILGLSSVDDLEMVHKAMAHDLSGFTGTELGYTLDVHVDWEETDIPSKNVMGYLEGCHETRKNELVVMSAHYDHMGIGTPDENGDMIYNGADDNGSGTVTTLTLAQALAKAKEKGQCLDRSILFLFVTGEEHGLLGSRYYSENPVFPIEQTVANFNLDMFGRIDYDYQEKDEDYIYIIGADIISSQLDSLLHVANERSAGLTLDMKYNDLDDRNQFYRRSDHWNFGRLGVPFIFFFSGLHDDYHEPSDSIEKIAFELLEKRAQLIYSTLIEVANFPERPVVDNQEFIRRTQK